MIRYSLILVKTTTHLIFICELAIFNISLETLWRNVTLKKALVLTYKALVKYCNTSNSGLFFYRNYYIKQDMKKLNFRFNFESTLYNFEIFSFV